MKMNSGGKYSALQMRTTYKYTNKFRKHLNQVDNGSVTEKVMQGCNNQWPFVAYHPVSLLKSIIIKK